MFERSTWEIWEALPSDTKERIKGLHNAAQYICDLIDKAVDNGDKVALNNLKHVLECLEYAMQGEWGFEKDPNKHTWWLKSSSCKCPKLDNLDPAYYGGGKIITEDCPIHGKRK